MQRETGERQLCAQPFANQMSCNLDVRACLNSRHSSRRPLGRPCACRQRKSRPPGFSILRASYRNRGSQLVLIFEAAAALGRFARLGSSRMATRFTFFTSDPACLEPRLCAAYSWPSTGATCGGSLPRYGRPIPNSLPCASTHFQSFSEEDHRWSRVLTWTLTISAASPCP